MSSDDLRSDDDLAQSARAGDLEALERLFVKFSRALFVKAFACTGDRSSAEDLVQDTYLQATTHVNRLREPRQFKAWLLSILDHRCMEWYRARRVREEHKEPLGRELARRSGDAGPERSLAEAIASLPPKQQEMLNLRHGLGMSCQAIADEMELPLGTVTKTLSRAYATLREKTVDHDG